MRITCTSCEAKYSISEDRLAGRRVKVRCRKCGESFPVDAPAPPSEAVCAPPRMTGERNESSVLFSLETLSQMVPAPAPEPKTEGSSLIDLRALAATTPAHETAIDDVLHLGGGGAFATPMLYAEDPPEPRSSKRALVAAI